MTVWKNDVCKAGSGRTMYEKLGGDGSGGGRRMTVATAWDAVRYGT